MKTCLLCHGPHQKGASGPSSIFKKIVELCKENLLSDLTKEWVSTWDFGKQNQLPFCISCFKSAQNLTELQEELVRIQKGFLNSVVIFTIGIVESRKKNKVYNKKGSPRNNKISGETIEDTMEYKDDEFPIDIKEEHFVDDWSEDLENDPLSTNVSDSSDGEQLATKTTSNSQRHKRMKSIPGKNIQKNPIVVLEKLRPAKCKSTAIVGSDKTPGAKIKHSQGKQSKSAVESPTYLEEIPPAILVDCFSDFDSNSVSDTTGLEVNATFEKQKMTSGSENIEKTERAFGQFPFVQKPLKVKRLRNADGEYTIFKCDVDNCDYSSRHRNNFQVHQQMRHGEPKLWPCLQCKKSFNMAQSLRSHNVKIHGYKVGPPRRRYRTPEDRIKHSQGKRSKSAVQSPNNLEETSPAIVVDCFSDFESNSVSDTTGLEVAATFEEPQMTSGSQNIEKTERAFKQFPAVQNSVQKKRVRNDSESTKLFKCEIDDCKYAAKTKYNLKVHQQLHGIDAKIFRCHQCKKDFKISQSLRTHNIRKHGYKVGPPRKKRTAQPTPMNE